MKSFSFFPKSVYSKVTLWRKRPKAATTSKQGREALQGLHRRRVNKSRVWFRKNCWAFFFAACFQSSSGRRRQDERKAHSGGKRIRRRKERGLTRAKWWALLIEGRCVCDFVLVWFLTHPLRLSLAPCSAGCHRAGLAKQTTPRRLRSPADVWLMSDSSNRSPHFLYVCTVYFSFSLYFWNGPHEYLSLEGKKAYERPRSEPHYYAFKRFVFLCTNNWFAVLFSSVAWYTDGILTMYFFIQSNSKYTIYTHFQKCYALC